MSFFTKLATPIGTLPCMLPSMSTTLSNMIYLMGPSSSVDVGQSVYNHLLWHVKRHRVKISICFSCLLSGVMLAQHPIQSRQKDALGLALRLLLSTIGCSKAPMSLTLLTISILHKVLISTFLLVFVC